MRGVPLGLWRPRLSFRAKLALAANLLVLVMVLGAAALIEHRQRTTIIQEVEKRAVLMAQALVSTTLSDLLTYNYVSIEQTVRQFSKKPDLAYVVVQDKEGNVATQFIRDSPLGQILRLPAPGAGRPRQSAAEQILLPGTEGETVYDVTLPVTVEGSPDPWGHIRLGVSLKAMHQEIARTRLQIVGVGILGLLLGSAGALFLARRMTRPIQGLMAGVTAVGQGDFAHRIAVTSGDELGRLSEAFNEMGVQLARVRELEERLRRADRLAALGTMAAGIAHDIRNPLTSIQIFSQLMSSRPDDPSVREKFERVVPRELARVQAVIEDMMELARPSPLQLEPLDLGELLTQLLELYEEQMAAQRIRPIREIDPRLPLFDGDKKRLLRCLGNFITNAIQAMPEGGELRVRVTREGGVVFAEERQPAGAVQDAIQVEITDTGFGIPPDRLPRIFDPFYTTKEKGLGMGMAIAYRITEDHRGTIDVQSREGFGTTFRIYFPLPAGALAPPPHAVA